MLRVAGRWRSLGRRDFLGALLNANCSWHAAVADEPRVLLGGSAASGQLWKHDSPLLRHLSTSAWHAAASSQPDMEAAVDALPDYGEMKQRAHVAEAAPEQQLELLPGELQRVWRVLRHFQHSAAVKDQALGLYVNSKLFNQAVQEFQEFVLLGMLPPLRDALLELGPGPEAADALFPLFAQFVLDRHMEDIRSYRNIIKTADLRKPHSWFPVARSLNRRIVYHAGPTNSGKTYNALVAMKGAESGVYCGPLRLLAMEVYDNCNADGTYCNLVTGQERRLVPGAQHTACTVEMVNMQRRVDVAVIDEIQMMGDEQRGWAWTRALMGVPANEVHICGDGSAAELVRQICEEMGEPFELRSYQRFTSLDVEREGLQGGYRAVQPGDCVVAFSRKDIYAIKQFIERETQHRACVVYGALPPETRRMQARLFNEAETRYKVLVASDAVGMGLNLNIRRIIFHSLSKFDGGRKRVPVSTSMIKQIAGRAGRRSSQWSGGLATCRNPRDVARLQEALQVPMEQLSTPTAGLFPEFEHLEVFAGQHPDEPFRRLLTMFGENALLDSSYFFCKQDSVLGAASLLAEIPLSLRDTYNFCMAPASHKDLRLAAALLQFASKYSRGVPVELGMYVPDRVPSNVDELKIMETTHQVAMLWLWLSYRYDEESFPGREAAEQTAARICDLLDKGLERVTRMCKRGVDISTEPARPLMEGALDFLSDEYRQLAASAASARSSRQRRPRKLEERLVAAQLALELAASGEAPEWAALGGGAAAGGGSGGVERAERRRGAARSGRRGALVLPGESTSKVGVDVDVEAEVEAGSGSEEEGEGVEGEQAEQGAPAGPKLFVPREAPMPSAPAAAAAAAAEQAQQAGGALGLLRKVFGLRLGSQQAEAQQQQAQGQQQQVQPKHARVLSNSEALAAGVTAAAVRRRRQEFQRRRRQQAGGAAAAGSAGQQAQQGPSAASAGR